jgi:tellurite resistance protein
MHANPLGDHPAARVQLAQDQALVVIGFGGVSSDGRVGPEEVLAVTAALARLHVLDSDQARDELVHEVVRMVDEHGLGPLTTTALSVLAGERREHALRVAFAVLLADGELPDAELAFAAALQAALEISDERYAALLAEA